MIRAIILVAAAAALAVLSAPALAGAPFDGAYVGHGPIFAEEGAGSGIGLSGDLFAGHGLALADGWHVGAELGAAVSEGEVSAGADEDGFRAPYSVGVTIRGGHLLSPGTMLYGLAGLEAAYGRAAVGDGFVVGYRVGAGVEQDIAPGLSVRGQVSRVILPKIQAPSPDARARADLVSVALVHRF